MSNWAWPDGCKKGLPAPMRAKRARVSLPIDSHPHSRRSPHPSPLSCERISPPRRLVGTRRRASSPLQRLNSPPPLPLPSAPAPLGSLSSLPAACAAASLPMRMGEQSATRDAAVTADGEEGKDGSFPCARFARRRAPGHGRRGHGSCSPRSCTGASTHTHARSQLPHEHTHAHSRPAHALY